MVAFIKLFKLSWCRQHCSRNQLLARGAHHPQVGTRGPPAGAAPPSLPPRRFDGEGRLAPRRTVTLVGWNRQTKYKVALCGDHCSRELGQLGTPQAVCDGKAAPRRWAPHRRPIRARRGVPQAGRPWGPTPCPPGPRPALDSNSLAVRESPHENARGPRPRRTVASGRARARGRAGGRAAPAASDRRARGRRAQRGTARSQSRADGGRPRRRRPGARTTADHSRSSLGRDAPADGGGPRGRR